MFVKVRQKDLVAAVDKVAKIVPSRATLPAVTGILCEADEENGTFVLRGTNLEVGIEVKVPADITSHGKVLINASVFSRTLKTIREQEPITLSFEKNTFLVKSKEASIKLQVMDASEFPVIPRPENESTFRCSASDMLQGFQAVMHSAATSLIKPELAAVYLYHEQGYIHFVATDQFRLAEKRVSSNEEIPPTIIPIAHVHEITHLLSSFPNETIVWMNDDDQVSLQVGQVYLTSRVVNGSFPDYRTIIPQTYNTEVVVLKEDVANALQKVSIFADKFGKTVVSVNAETKTLTFTASNDVVGEVEDTLEATISGESLVRSFNYRYLKDTLPSIRTESVRLLFAEPHQPLVMKGVNDESYQYLVMPMNQ